MPMARRTRPGWRLDYLPASGTLNFAVGQLRGQIELQVLDNTVPDADRTVRLNLQSVGVSTFPLPAVELIIMNDDLGLSGIAHFPNGRVMLRITGGQENQDFSIQRSRDLSSDWEDYLQIWPGMSGRNECFDDQALDESRFFYRIKMVGQ